MDLLLEAAAGNADQTGAIVTGLIVFASLLCLVAILTTFGRARPHAVSEKE